jgi:fimbrial chaperone protein
MQRHLNRQCLAAFVAALFLTAGATQAQVLISPVVVELGDRQRAVAVTVTLGATARAPVLFQSEVLRWQQHSDGTPLYEPSNDLVVSPPVTTVHPGESQVIRVALRGPRSSPGELAYRLILEDASEPLPAAAGAPGGINFRMRYSLPVLVAPVEPVRNALHWQACAAAASEVCVHLANEGNRRVTFKTLSVAGANWTLPVPQPGTVLAGAGIEWRLPLPRDQNGPALRVSGETSGGETVKAELAAP